ncbi:MaoC family dehydratase N-terminal domain-containing protein [Demequina sp. TTPB684]|uniref:FAS1-like dehydratase domain-containing protein n=1 Tax=unclassified Demequina TaxID=2620311 RepID=UPI001CF59A8F|nr:MaoC family dehydratase N-terminal domain-containing protein [Demequina sp. TMPB413]MCB2412964.1 MaoC family dehydratase N-terminal domain-containing protein [Demequina sp. TTPB684]UPU88348.1 MaoC family dehydratase N-terminal domain-containing protein [Demequina sp. TMPB413]
MPVNPETQGRSYGPFEPYEVTRGAIRSFADAVDARSGAHFYSEVARAEGYADVVAPTTFAVTIAQQAEFHVVTDPEVGVDFSKVVHAEQRFTHHRPIVAGDVVRAGITIESITSRAGISMVTTRAELTDADGVPLTTVMSTLAVREDQS